MRYYRVLTAIVISLAVHLLSGFTLAWIVPKYFADLPPKRQTYVELMESPELRRRPHQDQKDEKQIVRQAKVPEELLTHDKKKARFSSEDEQRVVEETRARNNGMTENLAAQGLPGLKSFAPNTPKTPAQKEAEQAKQNELKKSKIAGAPAHEDAPQIDPFRLTPPSEGDVAIAKVAPTPNPQDDDVAPDGSRPLELPRFSGSGKGVSTVGEQLPDDIRIGDFTALNTDRALYYSFYARMEEGIRHRWEAYVRGVLNTAMATHTGLGRSLLTTKLEIILDDRGNFVKAILEDSSGNRGLDSAPVQAFRDAKQFPNPPQEMVKDDHQIHIEYAFTVEVSPQMVGAGRN